MAIYTIGDLHLSLKNPKPMDIFGDNWEKHEQKIKDDWISKVKEDDLIVLPGDFSWAMHLKDTYKDSELIVEHYAKRLLCNLFEKNKKR